jgi:hypothetical protein
MLGKEAKGVGKKDRRVLSKIVLGFVKGFVRVKNT